MTDDKRIDPAVAVRAMRSMGKTEAAEQLENLFDLKPAPPEPPPVAGTTQAPAGLEQDGDASLAMAKQWLNGVLGR